MKTLIIDAGHGGSDTGASAFGYLEKDLTLIVAKRVRELLREYNPDLTRYKDIELNSIDRTAKIKDKYKYCLSIHFNAAGGIGRGIETIHAINSVKGKELAQSIANSLNKTTKLDIRRIFSRKGKNGNYYYMHRMTGSTVTVIVECLFIDSEHDIQYLNIENIAQGIAEGFKEFIKQEEIIHVPKVEIKQRTILKLGSKGNNVKLLQEELNKLGYDCGTPDGIFGRGTQRAVLAFQELNKLYIDGIVGNEVYSKINELMNKDLTVGHRTMYQFGSYINVYQTKPGEIVDVDLGERYKLEPLSKIVKDKIKQGKKIVAAINGQFFSMDGSIEYLGTLIDEGLWYGSPNKSFIDFIYYKDGSTKIKHIKDLNEVAKLQGETNWAIGTSWSLIQEGFTNLENTEKILHSKYKHPRTLLGWRKNGQFVLVTIDGRSSKSEGVTAYESAKIMHMLNCWNAVNLDGGGSTEMILVNNDKINIVNNPSDKSERKIGTAILVYND